MKSELSSVSALLTFMSCIRIQAAKEFETELKKDDEDASKPTPPAESPKAVSNEDEEKELKASGTKKSL